MSAVDVGFLSKRNLLRAAASSGLYVGPFGGEIVVVSAEVDVVSPVVGVVVFVIGERSCGDIDVVLGIH